MFWIRRKVHWSDVDAAGIVWFPRFFAWVEDAEEELYAALGRPRHSLLEALNFGMPRVELQTKFASPARVGQIVRVGFDSRVENPRRIRHDFEIREDAPDRLIASGFVRVACVEWGTLLPRDLPPEVVQLLERLPELVELQRKGAIDIPWT